MTRDIQETEERVWLRAALFVAKQRFEAKFFAGTAQSTWCFRTRFFLRLAAPRLPANSLRQLALCVLRWSIVAGVATCSANGDR